MAVPSLSASSTITLLVHEHAVRTITVLPHALANKTLAFAKLYKFHQLKLMHNNNVINNKGAVK